jgi:magnesium transporter
MRIYLENKEGAASNPGSLVGIELASTGLLWIDLEDFTAEELEAVARLIGAHPVALGYCSRPGGLPKIQEYASNLFVSWSFVTESEDRPGIDTNQLCIFLGENYLVTTHQVPLGGLNEVWDRLAKDPEVYRHHPAPILYAVLDNAVDEFFPIIADVANSIDSYQDDLLGGMTDGTLQTIIDQKHRNTSMRRLVAAQRDVILKLERRDMPFIPQDLQVYIMDVYDLLVRATTEIDSNADQITSSMDIDLNMISNRLNVIMKKLTIVATIFLPLTFLVGLYGMNFKHMPELSWRYGYLAAWIAMFVIGVATYFFAKRFIEGSGSKSKKKSGGGS